MNVKEFLNLIDLESMNNQEITIIIPVKERMNGDINNAGELTLSDNEKVVFDCSEISSGWDELYSYYGIEPCLLNESEVDVRTSEDGYKYVFNEDGEIWIVVD